MPTPKGYGQPITGAQFDAIAEDARKKCEAQATAAANTPMSLGRALGLPVDAAAYILQLVARVEELEKKVAALQGPAHTQAVEKRAK